LLLVSSCVSTQSNLPPGQRLQVAAGTMSYYREYLRHLGSGAFAVSLSGRRSAYSYCPADRCLGGAGAFAGQAISMCEKEGDKCVLFASNTEILVPYDVVP
jgi:hypothetical protein